MIPGIVAVQRVVPAAVSLTDPYWANVVSLLHFDGADGSTVFTESGPIARTWTHTVAEIKTDQSKFGGASGYFNGSANINTPSTADWLLGSSDFTIEAWVRVTGTSNNFIIAKRATNTSSHNYSWYVTPTGSMFNYTVAGTASLAPTWGAANFTWEDRFTLGEWHHVAFVRSGSTTYEFVDGEIYRQGDMGSDVIFGSTQAVRVGATNSTPTGFFVGHMDEFRLTKAARYTSNFIPPASAFPNS